MKLPLFVCAQPTASLSSPSVLLKKGNWRVISNHKDSSLELRTTSQSFLIQDGMEFKIEETFVMVELVLVSKGSERTLSVSLESVRSYDGTHGSSISL
jgi:hypothetical protein